MGHEHKNIRQRTEIQNPSSRSKHVRNDDFVLEKGIFNNIFEKDIRRVFIYKKAERLAKALHLIAPAFAESVSLRNRIDAIAIGLVDAAVAPLGATRTALSRELLALSSVLSIARTGGLLSAMNAELISHEAHSLLQEVAAYEEPRLSFDEMPTLSGIAKDASRRGGEMETHTTPHKRVTISRGAHGITASNKKQEISSAFASKGHPPDRREAVMSVIQNKGSVSIKDISTLIRGVSEKTIQRELAALIESGLVVKQGERRWSTYLLA